MAGGGPYGGLNRYGWLLRLDHLRVLASSGEDGGCSFDAHEDTEDHDARARRSLGRVDDGDDDNCGLGARRLGFLMPRLSAVLPFACEYVYAAASVVAVDTVSELTVPARFRGGGCRDCEPISELTLPGTMICPSRSLGSPTFKPSPFVARDSAGSTMPSFSTKWRSLSGKIFLSSME